MLVITMKPASFLIYASYLLLATLVADGYLGINWGRMATQRMIPSMVVDVLLQNNLTEVKIYSASQNVLEALGGTNINLAITMPNGEVRARNTTSLIQEWIQAKIVNFLALDLRFRYVYVGTMPLSPKFFNQMFPESINVLDLMQKCLEDRNITGVKATFSNYPDILNSPITKPSMAEFRPDLKDLLLTACVTLERSNAPFGADIYPFLHVREHFFNDTEFAFFENNSTSKFKDGEFTYSNVFEVVYDSFVCALEKLGFPGLPIVVGGIGWPTDGIETGNLHNAERFHQGLAKFIKSQKGTPRRPGNIDVYIHNLADENAVNISAGTFMRHWGIYKFDGQPKYNLDFEGNERKILPVAAVGITHMPKRWCVLDEAKIDDASGIPFDTLDRYFDTACNQSDCTPLVPGGSCSGLQFPLNYSYAFNSGFQALQTDQGIRACGYGGFGVIVSQDPSTGDCTFPVQIIPAETPITYGKGRRE